MWVLGLWICTVLVWYCYALVLLNTLILMELSMYPRQIGGIPMNYEVPLVLNSWPMCNVWLCTILYCYYKAESLTGDYQIPKVLYQWSTILKLKWQKSFDKTDNRKWLSILSSCEQSISNNPINWAWYRLSKQCKF